MAATQGNEYDALLRHYNQRAQKEMSVAQNQRETQMSREQGMWERELARLNENLAENTTGRRAAFEREMEEAGMTHAGAMNDALAQQKADNRNIGQMMAKARAAGLGSRTELLELQNNAGRARRDAYEDKTERVEDLLEGLDDEIAAEKSEYSLAVEKARAAHGAEQEEIREAYNAAMKAAREERGRNKANILAQKLEEQLKVKAERRAQERKKGL